MASQQVFFACAWHIISLHGSGGRSVRPSARAQLIGNSGHNPPSTGYGTSWILDVGAVTWSTSLIGRDTGQRNDHG